jgi:phosphatidylglycerophosphate synthase
MLIISVFFLAFFVGYFVLPLVINREALHNFLYHTTSTEAGRRDKALKFLTDRLTFVTPNSVSIVGLFLVGLLVYLFLKDAPPLAIFIVTLTAGFTDMLDGSLARNTGQVTRSGAILDVLRDVLLALVVSWFLILEKILSLELFLSFLIGWLFLGVVRSIEFKLAGGGVFSSDEDYKFLLDRMRLFLYIVGILSLILIPFSEDFQSVGESLIIFAIVLSWFSLLLHSAHLKILREEKMGL